VRDRVEDERFIDTVQRIGVTPFKEHVYATPIKVPHAAGEDAYA
jgi:sulfite reductase (NADPH) hemoprotein beta-component